MGSAFSRYVFLEYTEAQVLKPRMDGFEDPSLGDFSLLYSSALMKEECKDELFEREFIRSFL